MPAFSKAMAIALLGLTLPVLAQEGSLQKGGAGKVILKKSAVVRLEDQATFMVNNVPCGTIKVVYYSGKNDVYVDGPTLIKRLLLDHHPSSLAVFDGPLGVTEWIAVKDLRDKGYHVTFSKLTLALALETPVANRLNQELSLKPNPSSGPTMKVTHRPALVSGVVNVGGVHPITPDTIQHAFSYGYDINGVLNLNQTLLRFWVLRPIPQTMTMGSFMDDKKTVLKSSDDWVWQNVALLRTDYENGVSYVLGDIQQSPNGLSSFPTVWGLGIHSMGRSHLVNANQRTTEAEVILTKRSELVIEINQHVIRRVVCNAGTYRLVDIPLKPFGNDIKIKIKPLQKNEADTILSKWVYVDPDILPIGRIESRFQVGVPLRVDVSGRQIDSSVWVLATGFNAGVFENTMAGSMVAISNKSTKIGLDMTMVAPIGKVRILPQFEQYGAYPVGHLQVGWTFLDASKAITRQPLGISFKSYVVNFPFSTTTTSDLKYGMSNALNVAWQWDSAFKIDSGLSHIMGYDKHKLFGTLSGTWDWGWVKWGGQWQWRLDDQQWQQNQSLSAGFALFQSRIQLGYYMIDQVSGVSASWVWHPLPQLQIQAQQLLNYDNTEWQYQVNEGTKVVASQTNKYHDTNTNMSLQQVQMTQGNQHELIDWMWSFKRVEPATPTASLPSTPYTMTHRLNVSNRRFVSGFSRMDYHDVKPEESVLSWGSAVVFADGKWGISRPISSGFVLVNVEGSAHAPEVYINKQPYYDALGASVYNQLNPYQSNSIEIEALSEQGEFLGSVPVRISPLPDQNYVVDLVATPRVTLSFNVTPYHQLRMLGQRATIRRLGDDADDRISVMVGANNQVVLQDVYPGTYEVTFSDTRLGRMIIKIADSVIDSKDIGVIPLGSQTVTVYAN